jgi:hypothetical protein
MIERIARRAGGFASTTAMRWLRAGSNVVPDVQLPTNQSSDRRRGPLTTGAALAGTVALVSSSKVLRAGVAYGLRKAAETLRTDDPTGAQDRASSSNGSGNTRTTRARSTQATAHNGSNGSKAHNGSNGSATTLSEKTRAELYEMAKKKNISGRSSMSKSELEKALR